MAKKIACLNDPSNHGGYIYTTNTDNTITADGDLVAVNGAMHHCPKFLHGNTPITAVTTVSYVNGKLVLTEGAVAGCGAVIQPPDRKVYVE